MNVLVRGVLVLLSAVAVLAGCAMDPAPSAPTTSRQVPKDVNLRKVTMTYKDGLAYTFGETSAQALCHALSPQEWRSLLGTEVGRSIEDYDDCVVAGGSLTITMSMESTEVSDPPYNRATEHIAGYSVWTERDRAVVDLADGPQPVFARPYLYVRVGTEPGDEDQRDLLRRLVTTLLSRLAHDGPATPVENADGRLAFTPTQSVPGVRLSDLPRPVLALVLCTVMTRTGAPKVTDVTTAGQCAAEGDSGRRASVTVENEAAGPARFMTGGRPARFNDRGAITIDLAELPAPESKHVYKRLTMEWRSADRATAKAWADQFVGQLGEL